MELTFKDSDSDNSGSQCSNPGASEGLDLIVPLTDKSR